MFLLGRTMHDTMIEAFHLALAVSLHRSLTLPLFQTRLRAEAQKALAQAQPMAHMQIEIEKMSRKKSPIEEIMSFHGINVADPTRKLTKTIMERDMNLAQLQVCL